MGSPLVTFLSDFGRDDWFVGVVHGVIHAISPETRVVDIGHAGPPGQVGRAAFILEAAAPDFAPGTIHLAVVDPGVGTRRRPIVVRARGQSFVGPDNGILEWALADPAAEAFAITEERFLRKPVSRTFHARDVFAPVAAHLARGESIANFGARIQDAARRPNARPRAVAGDIVGQVMFVDRFGNALTNIAVEDLLAHLGSAPEESLEVEAAGRVIRGLSRAYGDAPVGTLVTLVGSSGRLEISQVGGDAAERLGLSAGDEVRVRGTGG